MLGGSPRGIAFAVLLISACPRPVRAEPAVAPQPASTQVDAEPAPFTQGTRYVSINAGVSHRDTLAWIYPVHVLASYYLVDNLAIELGGIGGYIDAQREENGAYGGTEAGIRVQFPLRKRWAPYLEALASTVFQQHPLTPQSLRFNFDLQGGGGAVYRINRTLFAESGVRWHHLSNSRIRGKARNFGYDATMLYVGLMRSF